VTTFYIADFQIDLYRSVVIKDGLQTQVEPKVLKVLLLLAQRQDQVVTHQEIMQQVWQGTEVVPNALQRCIAILRKVLQDDAKSPTMIATHPRIGYRLLAQVSWKTIDDKQSVSHKVNERQASSKNKAVLLTTAISALLVIIFVAAFWSGTLPKSYTQVQVLTHTDAHESHALFSPDANYLLFNRYAGACKSHLWARNMANGKEKQLTTQPGLFGAMSFTPDGRELVFAASQECAKPDKKTNVPALNSNCWSIATLDFAQALVSPTQPMLRYQCQAESLLNPKALSNHKYAFLQYNQGQYQLNQYDDLNKTLTPLFGLEQEYIYHFDHDPIHKRFVIISRDKLFDHQVRLLAEDGQVIGQNKIQLLPGMSPNQQFSANFSPQGEYLLTSSNQQLYRLELNGQLKDIKTPQANLVSAVKHPHQKHLLAVTGAKDIDISQITLNGENTLATNLDLNSQVLPFSSLARTNAQERKARYQPKSDKIAFISDSGGGDQIWLWQQDQAAPLASAPSQGPIHDYSWSTDGKHLAWVYEDKLAISNLDGDLKVIEMDKPLYSVLAWYNENQFLLLINDPAPGGLYHLDLATNKLTALGINGVQNAWVSDNQLIYSRADGQAFSRSLDTNEPQSTSLPQLNGKALLLQDKFIYSVDKNSFVLNQYNLQGQFIQTIRPLEPTAWKVTDLRQNKVLLEQFIAINQEIVILQ